MCLDEKSAQPGDVAKTGLGAVALEGAYHLFKDLAGAGLLADAHGQSVEAGHLCMPLWAVCDAGVCLEVCENDLFEVLAVVHDRIGRGPPLLELENQAKFLHRRGLRLAHRVGESRGSECAQWD